MNNDTIVNTQDWFIKAVPEPTSKNISTQIGVHLEEVAEMLLEIGSNGSANASLLVEAINVLHALSRKMKKDETAYYIDDSRSINLLDALADQIVTAVGVGTFLGMNVPGALAEVNRSNFSKFEDGEPVFNENRKVMKGKDYTPPNLTPFI